MKKANFFRWVAGASVLMLLMQMIGFGNNATVYATESSTTDVGVQGTEVVESTKYLPLVEVNVQNNSDVETEVIAPTFEIENVGATSLNLWDLNLRYYFTDDGVMPLYNACIASDIGVGNIIGSFEEIEKASNDADHYFQLSFIESAGTLEPGESISISFELYKGLNETFDQSNDYSYVGSTNITAYYGYRLIYGEEIEAFADPSENFALGKSVAVSSSVSESETDYSTAWNKDYLVDGEVRSLEEVNNGWLSGEGDGQTVVIDLDDVQSINRVDLYAINWFSDERGKDGIVGQGYPKDFTIDVSEDGVDWSSVVEFEDVLRPTIAQNTYEFETVAARYVRISTIDNRQMSDDDRVALSEIKVFYDDSIEMTSNDSVSWQGETVVVSPVAFEGAMQNPLMGMTMKDFRVNTNNESCLYDWPLDYMPWASMMMSYIPWDVLEDDVDDTIEKIEAYCDERWGGYDSNGIWHPYEDYNIKVIPRVYLRFPDSAFHGLEGDRWPSDLNDGDFTSDEFDARLKRLMERLGALWDDDPRVAYVQMGIYGTWGEQHGTSVPEYVGEYFHQYFTNKNVEVRYSDGWEDFSFGQYNDSIANMRTIDEWKTQEVGGETAFDYNGFAITGYCPHESYTQDENTNNVANMLRNIHATYTTWIGEYTYRDKTEEHNGLNYYYPNRTKINENAEIIQSAFGYRFVITEFEYEKTIQPGDDFAVQFKVKNEGSAPIYYNWPVQVSLYDPETEEIVWSDEFEDLDITQWMPGEGYETWNNKEFGNWSTSVLDYDTEAQIYTVNNTFTLPETIDSKDYIIQLAVLDPAGEVPSLKFAINNYRNGGYSPMGYIGVGQEPEETTLDVSSFDNPAKDISLKYYTKNSTLQEASEITTVTIAEKKPVVGLNGDSFDLNTIPIYMDDQYGSRFSTMAGFDATWSIASGDYAAVSEELLEPLQTGIGQLQVAIDGVESENVINYYVVDDSNEGVLEGIIEDLNGNPLPNSTINIASDSGEWETITDNDGAYCIMNIVADDDYRVTVSADGWQEQVKRGVGVDALTVTTLDIELSQIASNYGNIDGRVLNTLGVPVEDVDVTIENGANTYLTVTDADGIFYVDLAEAATDYSITAEKINYVSTVQENVIVAEGISTPVDLAIKATTGDLSGNVTDNFGDAISGVTITLSKDEALYSATTDENGDYVISTVPEGNGFEVEFSADGYITDSVIDIEIAGAEVTQIDKVLDIVSAGEFLDDFTDGSDNWEVGDYGTWSVTDGEYCQTTVTSSSWNWKMSTAIADKIWYDAKYELDLKSVSDSSWGAIMFRKQNQDDNASGTGYFVYVTNTGKTVLAKAGSSVEILGTYEPATDIDMSVYHHLIVVTEGSRIMVYLDDTTTPVIDVEDDTYTFGYAGLAAGGSKWNFDNYSVSENLALDLTDETEEEVE